MKKSDNYSLKNKKINQFAELTRNKLTTNLSTDSLLEVPHKKK